MKFKFSKELINDGSTNRPRNQLRLYKIFDECNQVVGKFFYSPKKQILNFSDKEISIEVISKFMKKTKYFLVDKRDNKQIGEYEIFGGCGVNWFWQDIPSSPTGTIKIDDTLFNFRRIPPDIRYSFLKQDTWGYFKFRLYAIKGQEFYEYSLEMDIHAWDKANHIRYKPFDGTIESNSDNIFLILTGLYLMEVEFYFEDTKNDG